MGHSPWKMAKNEQKLMHFIHPKRIKNNIKRVKMTQNRSKPWAMVHGTWSMQNGQK
jgi:hypothetical protein